MSIDPQHEMTEATQDWVKPAFLRRVRIRGYKSIDFCDVELQPLTILVGRNAAGKSNFLSALGFLRDLMDMRLSEAVKRRNGWNAIHCRYASSSEIEIAVEVTFKSFKSTWDANYSFALEMVRPHQVSIQYEKLHLVEQGKERYIRFENVKGNVYWKSNENDFEPMMKSFSRMSTSSLESTSNLAPMFFRRPEPDRLFLSNIGSHPFIDIAEAFRASTLYNFSSSEIRKLQPISTLPTLSENGSNLARAIEGLLEIDPKTIERIRDYLKAIVPGIIGFRTIQYGDFETIKFTVDAGAGQPAMEFDASSMSDGTLRILATLIASFQIGLPCDPGFIGIEEPETALHPAAMSALVDALDEATQRTQILVTTHSADLLEGRDLTPGQILVVSNRGGLTQITPIDPASRSIVQKELYSLAELQRMDKLDLDENDLIRQNQIRQKVGE